MSKAFCNMGSFIIGEYCKNNVLAAFLWLQNVQNLNRVFYQQCSKRKTFLEQNKKNKYWTKIKDFSCKKQILRKRSSQKRCVSELVM